LIPLPDRVGRAEEGCVPLAGTTKRLVEVNLHEDTEVPVSVQLRPKKEYTIEQEYRIRWRLDGWLVNRGVG
jgi:hypothetical protein